MHYTSTAMAMIDMAASDTVMQCTHMNDVLDTVSKITKLVKFSPKREAQLGNIMADLGNDVLLVSLFFFIFLHFIQCQLYQ